MGFRHQELKNRGDSIELERKESFTTEHSRNGYIKRRKTVLRERFPHPNAKELRKQHKQQQPQRNATPSKQRPATESGRTTTETVGNSPGSATLISTCRDKTHLERAVNRTSVQLKRLAHEIDNEISKLKRERDKLMFRPRPHPLMRNAAIQNDFQADEATTTKLNLSQFNTIADNIEFTIEKFSSQHKFVCTSPRYARDEQTSCRPRMRTIGLQKDTQRSALDCDNFKNIKAKIETAINYSNTNLANLKAKGLLDPAPPNCYAFDYGCTGDGQKAVKIYHLENGRCTGGCNQNECNCQKVCEHYNSVGNYNGIVYNKNTYVEKGHTPCNEYKYCRDEYHYDYPKQNTLVPTTNAVFTPCVPCQPCPPCQPCVTYLPPCPTYNESQPAKPQTQVIYGRRMSDLNTDEFYHPTGTSPTKRSPTKHGGSGRHSSNKERLTVDVPKDGRTFVDIERHNRARSKSRRRDVEKTRQRRSNGEPSPDKAKRQMHERKSHRVSESSGSTDSVEKARRTKSKEKLLEITFTKERRRKNSSESGDEHMQYAMEKPVREYSRETKRSTKQMTITAYKPCKPGESDGRYGVDRNKAKIKRKSKDRGGDDKSDDDKTWDERLKQGEPPREDVDWNANIPTITEVYDNYRVGDAWVDVEDNAARQPTASQYMGSYRELYHVPPSRSYDIMPVQKNIVRDIPPSTSPERKREGRIAQNRDNSGSRTQGVDSRDRPKRGPEPRGQPRAGSDYTYGRDSDSFRAYRLEEQPRQDGSYSPVEKPAKRGGRETGPSYVSSDKSRPGPTSTPDGRQLSPGDYAPGKSYNNASPIHRADEERDMPSPVTTYTPDGKPYIARDYDTHAQSTSYRKHSPDSPTSKDREPREKRPSDITYTSDGKPRPAHDETRHPRKPGTTYTTEGKPRAEHSYERAIPYKSDSRYAPDSPRRKYYEDIRPAGTTYTPDRKPREGHDDARYGPDSDMRLSGTTTQSKPRSSRDYIHGVQSRSDERYAPHSPARADKEANFKPTPVTSYTPNGKPLSDHDVQPRLDEKYAPDSPPSKVVEPSVERTPGTAYSPDGTPRSARTRDPEVKSKLEKKYDPESPSHRMLDLNAISTPDTKYSPDGKLRSPRGPDNDRLKTTGDPDRIPPSDTQYRGKQDDEEEEFYRKAKPGSDHLQKTADTGADMASVRKVDKERTEQKYGHELDYGTKVKTESPGRDKQNEYKDIAPVGETAPGKLSSPRSSYLKSEQLGTGRTADSPGTSARTDKGDSGYKFLTTPEVPEITIEDLNDSSRSARSGRGESPRVGLPERAKFAIKGEMVLEPQQSGSTQHKISTESDKKQRDGDKSQQIEDQAQPGGKVIGPSGKSSKPEIYATTDKVEGGMWGMGLAATDERTELPGEKSGDAPYGGTERETRGAGLERSQVLSPFPSLESPTIYMRPRETCTDYKTACLPPSNDCTKKSSPRGNCIANAGDVYMCRPRKCTTQTASPPSSPCRCLSPQRSGSEVPYEKLGDQYTHSPVRQLAANSHLAVALQPEAATGNYIPSPAPQPQASKSCIYLRSTGTQYSATIIERQEDRCAPQYVPLPKHCSQTLADEAKNSPRQNFQTICEYDSPPNNNYSCLCDEESEEYEGKINFNNEPWCERVEITNSEKAQNIIAPAEEEQEEQQRKQQSKRTDCHNFLPWQQDQKFVPGQPMSDCNTSPYRSGLQQALKPIQQLQQQQRPRYQSITERRTPRFNATMPPHQELPEEEDRCALEMLQYKPQSRARFMEHNMRRYENCDPCCYAQAEDTNFQHEARGSSHECTPRGRPVFDSCLEYQQIPEFKGCPCMFKTYLNMITLYYPEYRAQISDGDSAIEDAEYIDC